MQFGSFSVEKDAIMPSEEKEGKEPLEDLVRSFFIVDLGCLNIADTMSIINFFYLSRLFSGTTYLLRHGANFSLIKA